MATTLLRGVVEIDEELCDGCGQCVPACAEGALAVLGGKARLLKDRYCDGLGACLGDCPRGAIRIVERQAEAYDEGAVAAHLRAREELERMRAHAGGCPSARMAHFEPSAAPSQEGEPMPSALAQWPVQLGLVGPQAPYLQGADLLVAADCVPVAYGSFHPDLLAGRAMVLSCPKLDDVQQAEARLTAIIAEADIRSVTVVHMEVPCCFGLVRAAERALAASGKAIPFQTVKIGIRGDRKSG